MKIFIDGIEYDLVPKSPPDKKLDYEILEFRHTILGKNNVPFTLGSDKHYYTGLNGHIYNFPERYFIVNNATIQTVRRISDGVVFSVGDEVDSTWGKQIITDFEIYKDASMIVGFKTCKNPLEKIRKLPERTKLFTTEDGVDKYPGDDCIVVDLKTLKISGWYNLPKNLNNLSWDFNSQVKFNSQEYAKEYVAINKPTLSVTDILKLDLHWGSNDVFYVYKDKLIELAKSRL